MITGADARQQAMLNPQAQTWWQEVDCGFQSVADVFEACVNEALSTFSSVQMQAYLEAARFLGKLGRGPEPMLAFLEEWPSVATYIGSGDSTLLPALMNLVRVLQKSPNSHAITPLLQTLAAVARRLQSAEQLQFYLDIAQDLMLRTTGSIHGHHSTHPSPGLPEFFAQAPFLTRLLSMAGLKNWVDYGIRNYGQHPVRQIDYFKLQSADSRAVLQRERHGTLFADVERQLDLYLRALWCDSGLLIPYSTTGDELRQPVPYYDTLGLRVPDVFDERNGISGVDRYRAVLAHMAGHRRWSRPQIADNWSPFQRLAVEFFEDCRVDTLLIRDYPGLRHLFVALHPQPLENACDPETTSCLRHRLAMLSWALLDPEHGYSDENLLDFARRFYEQLAEGESSTQEIASLALAYVARTRRQSDQLATVHFDNTVIDYRDDNRQLWQFIEYGDEEESFTTQRKPEPGEQQQGLPPRHYPEWDYQSRTYRPDWTSVHETLHPSGDAADIDRLLHKHSALAKRLKRLFDLLKPQDKVRIRHQEEGSELDLDIAIRSFIDFKSGATPDPRINMSHRTNGRDIAVMLLLDLSESLNQKVANGEQSILQLSQEAVALLAWAVDTLGDPLAIAGFHSNTRHDVRYQHIKGYSETWSDSVKARLAALSAGYSTRMGAAMRHAAHYLENQKSDKKLLLILTDGEPADVDTPDPRTLIEDARQAVQELDSKGIYTHCINLDPRADDYVSQIFGQHYTVIDNIARLPERLPQVFLALTK
ncbi:VWA domain-containing protein [Propionivibrio sp.]|uniref:nitric oxide reductase activation protein NorD n=1 Tax=Propionivibrio sp. TaxID=2212460 RepID=UPI00261655A8|nr:VWA domain-containing protein [Propionivibrio sp.]